MADKLAEFLPELLQAPQYMQAGVDVSPTSSLLFGAALISSTLASLFDLYVSLRQRKMYYLRELPAAVEKEISSLSDEEMSSLIASMKKREEKQGAGAKTDDHATNNKSGDDTDMNLMSHVHRKFLKAQAYGLDKSTFGILQAMAMLVLNIAFTIGGFMPYLYDLSKHILMQSNATAIYSEREIPVSLMFITLYFLQSTILGMPFSLYSTFVIEEHHGFNKQTVAGFFKDMVIQSVVMAVIGYPLISALIAIVHWGGDLFFVYATVFLVAVQLFLMTVYPNFIAPLFNTFTPLAEGSLRSKIFELAESQEFPCKQLFVMDGSRRHAHSNAYFYGFWKHKRIVLFDTLLEQTEEDEICGILAHEIGHWKMGHTVSMMIMQVTQLSILLFGFSKFATSKDMYAAFGFQEQPVFIGLLLFISLAFEPLGPILSFAISALSRRWEYQADAFAHKLGYSSLLQKGLLKLHLENLSAMAVDPLYSAYHYSHPALPERLKALQLLDSKSK